MGGASGKRSAVAVLVGIGLALGGLGGPRPASARREPGRGGGDGHSQPQNEQLYGCDRTFGRSPEGHLEKRTDPGGDHDVHPGETIAFTVTWDPADWSSAELHKVLDCVAIDGRLVPSMQRGESPTDNDGHFASAYSVPGDAPDGARICDQAMLSGRSPRSDYDRQISNRVCHTVSRSAACCSGDNGCSRCRKAPCDKGCDRKAPCGDDERACGDKAPPRDDSCRDKAPCGEKGCDGRPPCGDHGHRRDDDGLLRRLIHKLI